jgi:hypothetical protein
MIWLYGDRGKYQQLQPVLTDEELNSLLFNASQILISRAKTQAAGLLAAFSFMLHEATNDYNDEFTVLETQVALRQYEYLREASQSADTRRAFSQIANVIEEIGPLHLQYVRYITCELDRSEPPTNWRSDLANSISILNANQAIFTFRDSPKIIYEGLSFRSKTEIKLYEALLKRGLLVLPLPLAVLGRQRRYKEPDFVVCYKGKCGILEIHGDKWHPPETAAQEHERRREFINLGVNIFEIFAADRCWRDPEGVVNDFLKAFANA